MSMEQCLWHMRCARRFYTWASIISFSAAIKCKLLLYADDSVSLASGRDICRNQGKFKFSTGILE